MKKFLSILVLSIALSSCAELQQIASQLPTGGVLSQADIALGLQQALDQGIDEEVKKLTLKDGFFKNELVKILLPEELRKVDSGLRKIGLDFVADEGLKLLNRAAEDAVKEAAPIFVQAVKEITFNDAKSILLGDKTAATSYLQTKTRTALYNKFSPVVTSNLNQVGAAGFWSKYITQYNNLPFTNDVNPDLTDYVTEQALNGVFTMIELEEKEIRAKLGARKTDLMKKVFALQD